MERRAVNGRRAMADLRAFVENIVLVVVPATTLF